MSEKTSDGLLAVGIVVGFLIGIIGLAAIVRLTDSAKDQVEARIYADAVRLGHGEWIPGDDNNPKFRWKQLNENPRR